MHRKRRIVFFAACLSAGSPAAAQAQDGGTWPDIQVKGLLDGRLALTGDTRSWFDRGFGKTRYGAGGDGTSRPLVRFADAAAVVQAHLTWDLTAVADITASPEQRVALDATEAFVVYKPAPGGRFRFRAKAGVFFPPISLENTGLGWTSPYTISSSAINTWVGEELRIIGGEATAAWAGETGEFSVSGAVFGANDPAGSLLAWRGWAVHDREASLSDRLPLVSLPTFGPNGVARGQAVAVTPFVELDDRAGFYASAAWQGADGLRIQGLYYDNRTNSRVFDGEQYGWRTRFGSLGVSDTFGEHLDVVMQAMAGNTKMAQFPTFTVVDNDFASVFALASWGWGNRRLAARVEYFEVKDHDMTADDPNGEHGRALTLGYVYRPADNQRVTLEALNIRSSRQIRARLGLPARADETQLQLSYRYFFSAG